MSDEPDGYDLQMLPATQEARLWKKVCEKAEADAAALQAENERLKGERDEARFNAERFRQSMYAVEEHSLVNLTRAEKAEAELAGARTQVPVGLAAALRDAAQLNTGKACRVIIAAADFLDPLAQGDAE